MSPKVALLVPEGQARTLPILPAPRLGELKGKVIGFMPNGKPNADLLLSRLANLTQKKYGLGEARTRAKPRSTGPAAFIEELANECQGVVNGIGD